MRPWALGAAALTLLLIAAVFISQSTRTYVGEAIIGTPQPAITTEQVLLSTSDTHYRIEAVVKNPLQQDVLVTHVSVIAIALKEYDEGACNGGPKICGGSSTRYTLANAAKVITATQEKTIFDFALSPQEQPEYTYSAEGEVSQSECGGCQVTYFSVDSDTGFSIPGQVFHSYELLVPRTFQVEHSSMFDDSKLSSSIISPDLSNYDAVCLKITFNSQHEPAIKCACTRRNANEQLCEELTQDWLR